MPFRFLEEIATADVAFKAWGDTLQELFISSAAALLGTMTGSGTGGAMRGAHGQVGARGVGPAAVLIPAGIDLL
jgi:SHS2 domain-containing protein